MEYNEKQLETLPCAWRHYTWVDSTNTQAFQLVHESHEYLKNDDEHCVRYVLSADKQSAGRGRLGRSWQDAGDINFAATFVCALSNDVYEKSGRWISSLAGVSAVEAIKRVCGIKEVGVKWPNDIYVRGCKLGGILCEVVRNTHNAQPVYVLIGVGINLSAAPRLNADYQAVSVADLLPETDTDFSQLRDVLIRHIASRLDNLLHSRDMGKIRELVESHGCMTGKRVKVTLPDNSQIFGRAAGIARDASLIVVDDNTQEQTRITVGDVVFCNPSERNDL